MYNYVMWTNLDITRVGPEQFTHQQKTEISVNIPLMNLYSSTQKITRTV